MKRTLLWLSIFAIFGSTAVVTASAAVKTGSACSKVNLTSTVGGYKYTCIKSGKKLVWSKGVKVVAKATPTPTPTPKPAPSATPTPTPEPTPTPTPTPTPSATPTPTATPEPTPTPAPSPSPTPTPSATPTPTPSATTTPEPTPTPAASPSPTPTPKILTALEKMNLDIYNRYLAAEKKISPSFNFVRCPNVDPAMAAITENAYIDAYSFWATIYKSTAKVNWLLMSEKDWTCWYDTTAIFEGPNPVSRSWNVWNKDTGVMGHCAVAAGAYCGYGTGVQAGGIFAQYNMIGSNYKIAPTPLTVHHETVHNYQAQLIADNYQTSKTNTVAYWFMEGQANLFGVPIATKGDPTEYRNFEISRLLKVYPKGASYTKEDWLGVLNYLKTDSDFCFKNELGYSLGWFALEWTYMNYSIEEMHNFLEAIAKGLTWEQAIQTVMKMDEQTYYGKIAQYFADTF